MGAKALRFGFEEMVISAAKSSFASWRLGDNRSETFIPFTFPLFNLICRSRG